MHNDQFEMFKFIMNLFLNIFSSGKTGFRFLDFTGFVSLDFVNVLNFS